MLNLAPDSTKLRWTGRMERTNSEGHVNFAWAKIDMASLMSIFTQAKIDMAVHHVDFRPGEN